MSDHTPAPLDWCSTPVSDTSDGFYAYVTDANGRKIAALWGSDEEKAANARLFSAAPELLEALRRAKDTIRSWHYIGTPRDQRDALWAIYDRSAPEMQAINRAIAKAERGQ